MILSKLLRVIYINMISKWINSFNKLFRLFRNQFIIFNFINRVLFLLFN
jgi:hypothetical protein